MIEPVPVPLGSEELEKSLAYLDSWDIETFDEDVNSVRESLVGTGNVSSLAWMLVWRSRVLRIIAKHDIDVVDETNTQLNLTWQDILTDDQRNFDSLFFEFEVAALLLSTGLDIAFIEESGEGPAPDLLVEGEMWVECKRRGEELETTTWAREKQRILNDVIKEGMELDDTIHSFTVTFHGSQSPEEIDAIAETLRWMIQDDIDEYSEERYHVDRREGSVRLSDDGMHVKIGSDYHRVGAVDSRILTHNDENLIMRGYTGVELRFAFDEGWFYPRKVQNRLQSARSQNLSTKEKGAVFVYVPPLYLQEMQQKDTPDVHLGPDSEPMIQLKRLEEIITKRFLNDTRTVNAVVLCSNTLTENVGYFPTFLYWENKDCRHPDHEYFVNALDRLLKSYFGYLQAHS